MSNSTVVWASRAGRTVAAIAMTLVTTSLMSARADEPNNIAKPWDCSVALGLSLTRGNSDSENMNGTFLGDKLWTDDELRLKLVGIYGVTDGTRSADSLEGNAQWNHSFTPRWYSAVIADGLHDGVARLAYRVTLAPNVGYYFIKSDLTKLDMETGPGFIMQKYDGEDSQQYVTLRVAERCEHKLSATAKIWESVEWLPKIDDFEDYLLNTEAGIEASITKAFSIRGVITDRYNSRPAVTTDPRTRDNDIQLVSSLVYKF